MALTSVVGVFLSLMVLVQAACAADHLSNGLLLKGSVSCMDCTRLHNLADLVVSVKCSHEKNLANATTDEEGHFEAELPPTATSCLAMLLGGPEQLCSPKKALVSKVVKMGSSNHYTISTPLTFFTSCSSTAKDKKRSSGGGGGAKAAVESSKTVNIPLPPEWGLAPSSYYYYPFIPIIGIP